MVLFDKLLLDQVLLQKKFWITVEHQILGLEMRPNIQKIVPKQSNQKRRGFEKKRERQKKVIYDLEDSKGSSVKRLNSSFLDDGNN